MIRRLRAHGLTIYAAFAFLYLLLPIFVVIAFSFNDPKGRFNFTWQGFTLDNWLHPFDYPAAAALSFVLMAAILVAVGLYARLLGTDRLTG